MQKKINILLIDDDKKFTKRVKSVLEKIGKVIIGYNEEDFYKLFNPYFYDIILIDMRLRKEKEGLELVKYVREQDPLVPIIVITAYGSIDTAIEALHAGAKTYVQKEKLSDTELKAIVEKYVLEKKHQEKIDALLRDKEKVQIIGESPKIKEILKLAKLAAEDGNASVLIRGETGTGKELIAKFIHETGVRKEGPFVPVAISALNKSTLVAELFGYEKGAFTGATSAHKGYFEQAHKGILFLDEIGELDLDVQKMLLRVLETHTFRKMGGKQDIKIDFQLITATNAPLEEMIQKGTFREDLYYRLKIIEIQLPPLRERGEDILLLADYFLKKLFQKGRTSAKEFSQETKRLFLTYSWPGNVRELKHVVEYAALKAKLDNSPLITLAYLPEAFTNNFTIPHKSGFDKESSVNIEKILAEIELKYIEEALKRSNWKKTKVWKLLGYKNRFILRRRVIKIFDKFPELKTTYPELYKAFISL